MQPQPVFHTSIAIGPILLLVCLGITVGVVMAIRHGYGKVLLGVGLVGLLLAGFVGTSVWSQSVPTPQQQIAVRTPIALTVLLVGIWLVSQLGLGFYMRDGAKKGGWTTAWMMLGVVGLAATIWLSQSKYQVSDSASSNQIATRSGGYSHSETSSSPASSLPPTPSGPAPNLILYTSGNAQPIPIQELPGWRKNPPHEGALGAGRAKYVLTSQQFATVEEAEAELFKSLTADVQKSFAQYYTPAVGWQPTPEDLRLSGIIAERVIETFSVKVGEFENPVHRVSWLIEFDHDKSTVLLKRWEPIEAQRRSKLILSILAGASGVLGVMAMTLRRRRTHSASLTGEAA